MARPAKPSDGRPKFAVFAISVGWVAGMNGVKFRILKTLKKLARIASLESSPRNATLGIAKSLPMVRSTDVYPGPLKMLRHRQPGPSVVVSNSAAGSGKIPLSHCFLLGLAIAPPK